MNNNFKKFLPSRKVVAFILVPICSFFVFLVLSFYIKSEKEETVLAKERLQKTIKESVVSKDTDNDGLLDWQERLHGTNENDPDTDRDGVVDGNEIKNGTDPLDPFNKVKKDEVEKIEESSEKGGINKNLTTTEKIAREMFKKTVELKADNLNNNSAALELVADEMYENSDILKITKNLTEKNLNISDETDLYTFKTKFNKILEEKQKTKLEAEWVLGYKYIVEKDDKAKEDLESNMHFYISTQKELLALDVPNDKEFIKIYLDYLNSYFFIIEYIEQIIYHKDDPIKALAFFQSFDTMSNIIIKRGIVVYKYLNNNNNNI